MGSSDKRFEAIAELFQSEISYLSDLELWITLIKFNILGGSLANNRKYAKVSNILSHITPIYDLHKEIIKEMKNKNLELLNTGNSYKKETFGENILDMSSLIALKASDVPKEDLEYFSVYSRLSNNFECYKKYIENLPRDEYELKRLMYQDEAFNKIIIDYFVEKNVLYLGIDHFLTRPSSKISRYPSLFKAAAKRENDVEKQKKYQELIKVFSFKVREIDQVLKYRTDLFETFILSQRMTFDSSVKNKFSLGLIYKNTKLIKEGKLIVKKDKLIPATYKNIYIFNRTILICLTTESRFDSIVIDDDPIFLSHLYVVKRGVENFAENENLENLYPLYLIYKMNKSIKALYFEDEGSRELYYVIIKKAIKEVQRELDSDIGIEEIFRNENAFTGICKPENSLYSFIAYKGQEYSSSSTDLTHRADSSQSTSDDDNHNNSAASDANKKNFLDSLNRSTGDSIEENITSRQKKKKERGSKIFSESMTSFSMAVNTFSDQKSQEQNSSTDHSNNITYNFENFNKDNFNFDPISSVTSYKFSEVFEGDINDFYDQSDIDRENKDDAPTNKGNFCSNLFRNTAMPMDRTYIECEYSYNRVAKNKNMMIYSTRKGIFRILITESEGSLVTEEIKISDKQASKIFYDAELEILIFNSDGYAYIAWFNCEIKDIKAQSINTPIKGIFYGRFLDTSYLALVTSEEYSFSIINLLKLEYNADKKQLNISVIRKLYVGFIINNISFLKGRIIISCKDFEVIEIDTLRTQELLEVYDTSISILLESKEHFSARSIFKLDIDSYLLCFDGGGYLTDRLGKYKIDNVSFSWENLGKEFKHFEKWIIVVGECYTTIFEIETGKLVFIKYLPGLRLVEGCEMPLLYCDKSMYLIKFGKYSDGIEHRSKIYGFRNVSSESDMTRDSSDSDSTSNSNTEDDNESKSQKIDNGIYMEKDKDGSISRIVDDLINKSYSSTNLASGDISDSSTTDWESITIDGSKNKNTKNLSQRTSADKNLLDESNRPKELGKKTIKPEESSQLAAVSSARNRGKDYRPMANYEMQKEKISSEREVEEKNKRLEIYFSNYRIHSSQSRIFKPVYSWKRGATSVNSTKSRDGKIFEKIRSAKYNNLKKYSKNVVKRWKRKSQVGILDIIEGYESHEHK